PFTRNAFDPMGYKPMNLSDVRTHVKRRTTAAIGLAASVLFLSGIQHYAESPEGMATAPVYVTGCLRALPDSLDDVRFIDGFPGQSATIARKAGNRWYIAGTNGEDRAKRVTVDLSIFGNVDGGTLITDGGTAGSFVKEFIPVGERTIDI